MKRHAAGIGLSAAIGVSLCGLHSAQEDAFPIAIAEQAEQPVSLERAAPLSIVAQVVAPHAAWGTASRLARAENDSSLRPSKSGPSLSSPCARDMVEIEGDYCPAVEHICLKYVNDEMARDRCQQYRQSTRCVTKTAHKHFCIDRFEYPNREGEKPVVAVSWEEARDQCRTQGKRLCADGEWTLACEGNERQPYPYGFTRSAQACNIDKPYIMPDNDAFVNPRTRAAELARVDQREPSGSRESCVSPYGVFDMTGNVDEWVVNERGMPYADPFISGLKGGYWGPVRNRCRPMTTDHNQSHFGYQIGFRCCSDAQDPTSQSDAVVKSKNTPKPTVAMSTRTGS